MSDLGEVSDIRTVAYLVLRFVRDTHKELERRRELAFYRRALAGIHYSFVRDLVYGYVSYTATRSVRDSDGLIRPVSVEGRVMLRKSMFHNDYGSDHALCRRMFDIYGDDLVYSLNSYIPSGVGIVLYHRNEDNGEFYDYELRDIEVLMKSYRSKDCSFNKRCYWFDGKRNHNSLYRLLLRPMRLYGV